MLKTHTLRFLWENRRLPFGITTNTEVTLRFLSLYIRFARLHRFSRLPRGCHSKNRHRYRSKNRGPYYRTSVFLSLIDYTPPDNLSKTEIFVRKWRKIWNLKLECNDQNCILFITTSFKSLEAIFREMKESISRTQVPCWDWVLTGQFIVKNCF